MKSEPIIKQKIDDLRKDLSKCEDPHIRADIVTQINILLWVVEDYLK